MCYQNKDQLSAGIIVAGWDKEVGPSVYNIPLGGGLFRQPWAIGGVYLPVYLNALELNLRQALDLLTCTATAMPPTKKAGTRSRLSSLLRTVRNVPYSTRP